MPNHVWCEGELLAVEDKCSLICVEVILAEEASVLENFDPGLLLVDSVIVSGDVGAVLCYLQLVFGDSGVVGRDAVLEGLDVDLQLDHGQAHGLECHHNLGFGFEGAFVLVGVEDGLAHVKGGNSVIECTGVVVREVTTVSGAVAVPRA